mmetsp:Transcript_7785/g.14904  ORF Transcript_7785/g.14904 Transcript_7785/m.14904 type:complete len:144 (-) Transcript_7785:2792-3223(-)
MAVLRSELQKTTPRTYIRIREKLSALEKNFLDSLRENKRPKIRVRIDPDYAVEAEFIVPYESEPILRVPKQRLDSLFNPKRPRKLPSLSTSASISPRSDSFGSPRFQMMHTVTEHDISRHLPRATNYRKNVIRRMNRFDAYGL